MDMKEIPSSNNLFSLAYDEAARELHAVFCKWSPATEPGGARVKSVGAHYVYSDVPSDLYAELSTLSDTNDALIADGKEVETSVTRLFNQRIKGPDPKNPLFKYRKF